MVLKILIDDSMFVASSEERLLEKDTYNLRTIFFIIETPSDFVTPLGYKECLFLL